MNSLNAWEQWLQEKFNEKQVPMNEIMGYSFFSSSKRVRPALLLLVLEAYKTDPEQGYNAAAALEMIHTYSLIHDDLPCMDNDDFRRGKPSNHKAYGEAQALLAGDGLLTLAFEWLSDGTYPPETALELILLLSRKAGMEGMIHGQYLDLFYTSSDARPEWNDLEQIYLNKTARLIEWPLMAGALISGHPEHLEAWEQIGRLLGLQFQLVDDLLETVSDEKTAGKSLSDQRNEKNTYLSLFGMEKTRKKIHELTCEILDALDDLPIEKQNLEQFVKELENRIR